MKKIARNCHRQGKGIDRRGDRQAENTESGGKETSNTIIHPYKRTLEKKGMKGKEWEVLGSGVAAVVIEGRNAIQDMKGEVR